MPGPERRAQLLVLGTTCFGLFMVILDNTIVNVALPSIQADLHSSIAGLEWVVDAYIVTFASLLLPGGSLGDRFGRKRLFQAGLAVFVTGSAACGLAQSASALIAARVLQAAGGAMLLPASLSIITTTFTDARERAQAIGLWSGVSALSLLVGPVLGGLLTDTLGWQSVFFVNVPVGLAGLVVAARVITESTSPTPRPLDVPGLAAAVVFLGALTFGCIEGSRAGWTSPLILGSLALAAAALAVFLAVESRRSQPMLDLGFFRSARFSAAIVVGLLAFYGLASFTFFNSLFLQRVQGYSPLRAGVAVLPLTVAFVLSAPLAGRLAGRRGHRLPVALGTAMAGCAFLLLLRTRPGVPYAQLWWSFALLGAGLGQIIAPATDAAVSGMPPARAGVASGVTTTARQVGQALGIAITGAIVTARFSAALGDRLTAAGIAAPLRERALASVHAGGFLAPGGGGALRPLVEGAFVAGVHAGYLAGAAAMFAACLVALAFLRTTSPEPAGVSG